LLEGHKAPDLPYSMNPPGGLIVTPRRPDGRATPTSSQTYI
jgi:hypothetical protein